jgi:putative hydrolase
VATGPSVASGGSIPIQPAEVLRRIAFLLEAEGAETFKVQAFRRAAAAAATRGQDELCRLQAEHRLESLPGVGKTTATVIREALSGSLPGYLEALEARALRPEGPVKQFLEGLRGDCHSHSDWSDGGSPIEEMAAAAAGLGHEYLVITDHSPRLSVANGLSAERLRDQLALIERLNEELTPFRLLSGIEVDVLEDGSLDQDERLLARLDIVVASAHSKLRMGRAEMTKRMTRAISNPHVDILGHCTGRKLAGRAGRGSGARPPSEFDPELVFSACARHGVAVEVNSRPDRRDPPEELLRAALAAGCRVAVDSDAHAPGQLSWLRFGAEQAIAAGVPLSSAVNALPTTELLEWAKRHGEG